MGEIINTNTAIETQPGGDTGALLDITQSLLADARTALNSSGVLSVPIAELSTLGAGVSSLIPALNTVTQTTSIAADGLYTIANAGVGDVLKAAKNGNFWASLKTADGASKMVQLQEAGAITATTQTAAAFNPATMMMAVALFSIEQELGEIEDMQRQIISFLEIEKESEIEADVESLILRNPEAQASLLAPFIELSLNKRPNEANIKVRYGCKVKHQTAIIYWSPANKSQ